MDNKKICCELCSSSDMVRATVKENGTVIAICRECLSLYETDENLNPVYDHDPYDMPYFKKLDELFKDWENVTDIVPYNIKE